MKFIRLNKDTVRCILSSDDIKEQGLNMSDFLEQNENATRFIHRLIELAAEEIGYEVKNGMLTLRVMPIPGDKLSITISDSAPEDSGQEDFVDKMEALFRKLAELEHIKNMLSEEEADGEPETEAVIDYTVKTIGPNAISILAFTDLDQISEYAKAISYGRPVNSDLYKKGGAYFLVLKRGTMAKTSFAKICYMAVDFGATFVENEITAAFLMEHGEVLIRKKAITVMKKI